MVTLLVRITQDIIFCFGALLVVKHMPVFSMMKDIMLNKGYPYDVSLVFYSN